MPKANLEHRYEHCGYAYTARTRMMFAPKFAVTRNADHKGLPDIVLCAANHHPEPTKNDVAECIAALIFEFPSSPLFVDTAAGLIPVYQPEPSDKITVRDIPE